MDKDEFTGTIVNNVPLQFSNHIIDEKTLEKTISKTVHVKKKKEAFCIYGVRLSFEEMQTVFLDISEQVLQREQQQAFVELGAEYEDLIFEIETAYHTVKTKGEIYDFAGERVLNIYSFLEYFQFSKRFAETFDIKLSMRKYKDGRVKNNSRFFVDVFGGYDKLFDVMRLNKEQESFVFGVYVGTGGEHDNSLFLHQIDKRVNDNWKKYCESVLKNHNMTRKPSFQYVKQVEVLF